MYKIQILFPNPLMKRMKSIAEEQDIPVSEIVRRATEQWLARFPEKKEYSLQVPTIHAGKCLVDASKIRDHLYE